MKAGQTAPRNIDEYIAGFPKDVQARLQKIRSAIKKAAPGAEEKISYLMPAFKLNDRYFVAFAAFKKHISLFPAPRGVEQFKKELSHYKGGKGTVQFPLDKPIPFGLIKRIVKYRIKKNLERAKEKIESIQVADRMSTEFSNVYDDELRAKAYAVLEFPATYYLAYRDLPAIIAKHIQGKKALDFGCGAGRSTRFLVKLGFNVLGVDIAPPMLARARELDPQGDYRLVPDGDLGALEADAYDLILSAFTFDNVPTMERKLVLFQSLKHLLKGTGRIVNLVSSPEIYVHEWASFSTKAFPENRMAKSGERVRVLMLDVEDKRPVEDILWSDEDYREVYRRAGMTAIKTYRPLAKPSEPYPWVSETKVAPWVIYVLGCGV